MKRKYANLRSCSVCYKRFPNAALQVGKCRPCRIRSLVVAADRRLRKATNDTHTNNRTAARGIE